VDRSVTFIFIRKKSSEAMKWYMYIAGALALGLGIWFYLADQKKVNERMERVRAAKADKKIFSNLTNNDDEPIRKAAEEINPEGG
jgi:uncharacterized protein HemX